ncbi:hypothetical protein LEP1GSC073_1845 [Leptospira noguchii str. Cascata]|nr:hypothetical protein LEP1GSC073_1845 [Leptospira noguchii str. Cascata]
MNAKGINARQTQQNAFYESVNSAKRFLRKRFRSLEVTQRLASRVARQVAL